MTISLVRSAPTQHQETGDEAQQSRYQCCGGQSDQRVAKAALGEQPGGVGADAEKRRVAERDDQRTLAGTIGFDTSTIGGVIDRLEVRGWVQRNASPDDRRVRLLTLTDWGGALLEEAVPSVLRAQERMLEPLPKRERAEFMRMLRVLVTANNELSRAPSDAG